MRFQDAMYVMFDEEVAIKREGWHFSVFYAPQTGEFHTGYNNETWQPKAEDYLAEDWIVDSPIPRLIITSKLSVVK